MSDRERKERIKRIAAVINAGSDYEAIPGDYVIIVGGKDFFEMYDVGAFEGTVFKVAAEIVDDLDSRK